MHNKSILNDSIESTANEINLKYNEDVLVQEFWTYIKKTYAQHYVDPTDKGLQIFDLIMADKEMIPFARWSAITYLSRFGKKQGQNRTDLLKAMHYILMMLYVTKEKEKEKEPVNYNFGYQYGSISS
jgi:hypothetical protein